MKTQIQHHTLTGHVVTYDPPAPEVERFLQRVQALVDDPKATEDDVVSLIYGQENPILDRSLFPTRGAVTAAVLANPVYHVLTDLLNRKHLLVTKTPAERVAARFKLSVQEAAELKHVSEDAIRKAAAQNRIPSWKRDGSYFFEPKSLEAAELGTRGPVARATEPLEFSYGYSNADSTFLKVKCSGDKVEEIDPLKHRGAGGVSCLSLTVDRWRRVAVLTGGRSKLRMFVLVPSTEQNEIPWEGFYVRGKFSIEKKINNPKAAREAWDTFKAS
jgi:hypothetical protein